MSKKPKVYDDDDGRTIADMSGISRQPLILPKFSQFKKNNENPSDEKEEKPWEDNSFSKKERRSFVFGALGAAVLVGTVFAVAFLALILLMVFVWR